MTFDECVAECNRHGYTVALTFEPAHVVPGNGFIEPYLQWARWSIEVRRHPLRPNATPLPDHVQKTVFPTGCDWQCSPGHERRIANILEATLLKDLSEKGEALPSRFGWVTE